MSVKVLFTSVGRRVELVRAFRAAYTTLGLDGQIVATDVDPMSAALQIADRRWLVPRVDAPGYIEALVEICRRENVHRVFPLIDPDVPVLAAHRAQIESTGARLAVVDQRAAQVVQDKWLTREFFMASGVATPRSWLPGDVDLASLPYPVFIKPRTGSAGKNGFRVDSVHDASFFVNYVRDPIIQEFLPGSEITCDVICDVDGELMSVVCRRRIEVRWGEVAKGVVVRDIGLVESCARIAAALPAIGPITVQCIIKDGVPLFTEINARLGGGAPTIVAAGVDFPAWLLARAAGRAVVTPPLGEYRDGLRFTRFDDTFVLDDAAVDAVPSGLPSRLG